MAVTRKNQEPYQQNAQTTAAQQQMQQAQQNQPGAYQQSAGVQQAQQNLQNAQANKPGTYTQGDSVTAAQQQLQNINASKPQGYESKYGAQLDSILQQIQNPKEFKYSFDGDELFKYFADLFTQKGKQASADAMGQAAALTGGYGNSYGQMVGNQAYDQYLLNLYDKGIDLRNAAYQQYSDKLTNNYNIYNTLANADAADYNRYRDTVSDWQNERNYLTDYYNNERNFDYGQYRDTMADWQNEQNYLANRLDAERNYDYSLYRDQVNDWMTNRNYATNLYNNERNFDYGAYSDAANRAEQQYQYDASLEEQIRQNDLDEAYRQAQFAYTQQQDAKQFDENVRQFNESLNWDKMSAQQKYAAEWAAQILAMGQMPTAELLAQAGLSAADAQKLMAQIAKGGGGGGGSNIAYVRGADGKYYRVDDKGNLMKDKNGNLLVTPEDQLPTNAQYLANPQDNTITQIAKTMVQDQIRNNGYTPGMGSTKYENNMKDIQKAYSEEELKRIRSLYGED